MENKITGTVLHVFETKEHKNDFTTREMVVKTDEQYPQELLIQFVNKLCPVIENFKVGATVDIHFNIRGSSWVQQDGTQRWFNSLQGWKIDEVEGGGSVDNDPFP